MIKCLLILLVAICLSSTAFAAQPEIKASDLPRTKPVEPADAVKTFKVRPGFHIELVAAEPLVIDPIAMCFDENGRLFVVEMRDYSERRNEKLGRIRMLEDTDGDGVFDKSTVFLDHLPWPTAVMWTHGGILVGATPDILFARDTNGDGVADEVTKLFTGFGTTEEKLNVQGLFNNFIWGLDNRIHGCSGHDGGLIVPAANPKVDPLDVRGKGFVIDPRPADVRQWKMTLEEGGGQYGLSFDPTGHLFTCTNSSHCETFMFDARYASRNPYYTPPDPRISIAADGPAAEVFRISPEEPWRVIRTRWRIAGLAPGPIEGGGRSAGYFTGATGITIYKGDAFGPDYVGDAFVGDAGGNLVHHKRIRRAAGDLAPVATRPDDERKIEFCASTDTWFRPVDFANAPDGCLYIADMYREVIEHPWSIPPSIKKYLDLNSGNDRGRIYRLVPDGFKQPRLPRLGTASTEKLVAQLENPNGWHRETASRLLLERQDKSVIPLLERLMKSSTSALARLHALHALDGLGALNEDRVLVALTDADATVRAHAVALSEKLLKDRVASERLWGALKALAIDPDINVRYQLAFTLGELKNAGRIEALAKLGEHDGKDPWMQAAILTSVGDDGAAAALFQRLRDDGVGEMLQNSALVEVIGARHDRGEVKDVLSRVMVHGDEGFQMSTALGLLKGADQAGAVDSLRGEFDEAFKVAIAWINSRDGEPSIRENAAAVLGYADYDRAATALLKALDESGPAMQLAALNALDRLNDPRSTNQLVARFGKFSPRLKTEVVAMLMKRQDRKMRLLSAVKEGVVSRSDLSATQVNQLLGDADASVKNLAHQLLKPPTTQRSTVVEAFRPALSLVGGAEKGHAIYQQRCISCHRTGAEGSQVGPDLVTVKNSGKEKLLVSILDPNREVAPNYIAYSIDTKSGDNILGILASDTTTSITIRQAYGKETTLQRAQIKRMTSQGKSLMPEGLEADLTAQQVADLLAYIESAPAPTTATSRP